MFIARTPKIEHIYNKYQEFFPWRMEQLEDLLKWNTSVYIDESNVFLWQKHLWWVVDYKKIYQFFKSFQNIKDIHIYKGTLVWDLNSEKSINELKVYWYKVSTKDVKIMKKSIDCTSIPSKNDTNLLSSFIKPALLKDLPRDIVINLNTYFEELNQRWILYIEDRKCNFDVEMWVDISMDLERWLIDNFIIWSADSDFHDIVTKIKNKWKNVSIFWVSWLVSRELSHCWVFIQDIDKIKNFICWNRFIDNKFLDTQKGIPFRIP